MFNWKDNIKYVQDPIQLSKSWMQFSVAQWSIIMNVAMVYSRDTLEAWSHIITSSRDNKSN